jgi:WD40 repeat protein
LADDAGRVTVLNQGTTESSTRILVHNDQALVTSAPFRPCYYKALQIASGGTDCTIKLWDSAKPRKPLDHLLIRPSDTNVNQVCNPPMINHLAWSPSGRLLAAALGDGSCALLQVSDNRSLVLASRIEDAHSGPVASIVFPRWSSQEGQNNNAVTAHDRLMCTVGNDGSLVLWDIGSSLCGDSATDPISLFPVIGESVHSQEACVDDMMMDKPKTLLGWTHGKAKPNWLVSSCSCDSVFPSALFLADTTNDITVYSVPTS